MIDLYTAPTPNGWKASVTLEELEIPYATHAVDLAKEEQKQEWFLELNPNGRIPVIVDRDANDLAIFESGALMIYLAEKAGRLLPPTEPGRSRVLSWLMFQMGGLGPMMGQANVFYRYFPEKIQPAIDRYQNETRRLFEVLERGLTDSEWLAGEFSIADIANWCWARSYKWSGVPMEGLPNLQAWNKRMRARPGCDRGIKVPFEVGNLTKDDAAAEAFAKNAQKTLQT